MEQLKKQLLEEARRANICEEYYDLIAQAKNKEELIQLIWQGIDFCISKRFPSENLLMEHSELLGAHGIFIDEKIETNISMPQMWLKGSSNFPKAIKDSYSVAQYYVCDKSILQLKASENAFVVIDVFDDANVYINVFDDAKVLVNRYGNATVEHSTLANAYVKVVHKNKTTY